jgi:hypothetical protein
MPVSELTRDKWTPRDACEQEVPRADNGGHPDPAEHTQRKDGDYRDAKHERHVEHDVVGDEDAPAHVVGNRPLQDGVHGDLEHLGPSPDQDPADEVGAKS